MRTLGIWVFGLLASAIAGGFIGSIIGAAQYIAYDATAIGSAELFGSLGGLFGSLGGMFAFACIRLWLESN